jgi:hypothetical protein
LEAEINKAAGNYIIPSVEGNGMKINAHYFKGRFNQAISSQDKTCNPSWQESCPFSCWSDAISDPHPPTTTLAACRVKKIHN